MKSQSELHASPLMHETNAKASDPKVAILEAQAGPKTRSKNNGRSLVNGEPVSAEDLAAILASLQTMRDGDFSVRLPGSWTGIAGKIADTFNDIVAANQQMAQEL